MVFQKGLEDLAVRSGCTLSEVERGGLPTFLERFRKRYALLAGLALSLLAVLLMTQFVLVVDVSGNTEVPSATILSTLRRQGVRPGAFGPALEINYIEQRALLELEGISWMSINLHGARAEVLVRERVKAPELVDESEHGDIIAETDGEPCGHLSVERQGPDLFHLQKIYVLPRYQGIGAGAALFRLAVAYIRSVHPGRCLMELNVNRNNRALHFYERMGMRKLREGDFPIGDGYYMNDYIMGLDIK
mgnify:CR=1 FL=1